MCMCVLQWAHSVRRVFKLWLALIEKKNCKCFFWLIIRFKFSISSISWTKIPWFSMERGHAVLLCAPPPLPHALWAFLSHAYFQTQVINIRLTPVYKYWWVALSETHTTTNYPKRTRRDKHAIVDSDCPQLESDGNANKDVCGSSFSSRQSQISKYNPASVTCVDVKELTSLEFLLLLPLCLLSGQFSLLGLFFSLLSLLILLYCLLMKKDNIKKRIRRQSQPCLYLTWCGQFIEKSLIFVRIWSLCMVNVTVQQVNGIIVATGKTSYPTWNGTTAICV